MEINIRNIGKYTEVIIKEGNIVIDLGLLNEQEKRELASQLAYAVYELTN